MKGPQVPVAPVRVHVQNLIADGMTQAAICRAATVTSAYLSALLYGNYDEARTPMQTTSCDVADRLLAVRHEPSAPKPRPESTQCPPGVGFEPVGYRVGRCTECGQFAPVHTRDSVAVMTSHPRLPDGAQEPGAVPVAAVAAHPDCGTPKGHGRHRREGTDYCEPCKAARRGYEQGFDAGVAKTRREVAGPIPAPLVEEAVKAMRAVHYRRPYPQLRDLAATVVRTADAELCADEAA